MNKKGFAPIIIILIITLLAAGGITTYTVIKNKQPDIIGKEESYKETTTTIFTTTTTLTSAVDWSCGDLVTFTYKGGLVTYGTVESQCRCWLDRNLGASQVAISFDHSLSYGDLFQWGRGDDGHQDRDRRKEYTTNLSNSDDPGHNKFIGTLDDWRLPKNDNLWQGVSGINNPCPDGWRLPTSDEWETERLSWPSNNGAGAFASPLKLTAAGIRCWGDQPMINASFIGAYWSSTVAEGKVQEFDYSILPFSFRLSFREYSVLPSESLVQISDNIIADNASVNISERAKGFSVRCIKD